VATSAVEDTKGVMPKSIGRNQLIISLLRSLPNTSGTMQVICGFTDLFVTKGIVRSLNFRPLLVLGLVQGELGKTVIWTWSHERSWRISVWNTPIS
jgi:hypothetical protein